MMYLLGFAFGWWLGTIRSREPNSPFSSEQTGDLLFYCALGAVIGGRLGYILFYDFANYLSSPLSIFRVWEGGMAFHGGLLGVLIAMWLYGRQNGKAFFTVTDFIAPCIPPALFFGRIGNFINGELWGRPTDAPWGMVFPHVDSLARHPTMLYEALLEGILLFLLLWWFSRKPRPLMAVSGLFLIGYSLGRLFVEFYRLPDAHIGYLAFDWFTMGHLLSLPMLIAGIIIFWLAYRQHLQSTN